MFMHFCVGYDLGFVCFKLDNLLALGWDLFGYCENKGKMCDAFDSDICCFGF